MEKESSTQTSLVKKNDTKDREKGFFFWNYKWKCNNYLDSFKFACFQMEAYFSAISLHMAAKEPVQCLLTESLLQCYILVPMPSNRIYSFFNPVLPYSSKIWKDTCCQVLPLQPSDYPELAKGRFNPISWTLGSSCRMGTFINRRTIHHFPNQLLTQPYNN